MTAKPNDNKEMPNQAVTW